MISSYTILESTIKIQTPYCDDVVATCRKWAGKFIDNAWVVNKSRLSEVQEQLGVDTTNQVEVEVGLDEIEKHGSRGQQYRLGWYVLVSRRSRDSACDVYADLVSGELPSSGGSVKNPSVQASNDARFRLWVPRDFAIQRELMIVTDPNTNNQEDVQEDSLRSIPSELLLQEVRRRGLLQEAQ